MKLPEIKPKLKKFIHPKIKHPAIIVLALIEIALMYITTTIYLKQQEQNNELTKRIAEISTSQGNFKENFSNTLFEDHLKIAKSEKVSFELELLRTELTELQEQLDSETNEEIAEVYVLYESLVEKIDRNNENELEIVDINEIKNQIGGLLVDQNFEEISTIITTNSETLDAEYKEYLDSLKPPAPSSYEGYQYTHVNTDKGGFNVSLIKVPFNSVRVKTVSAHSGSCSNNCNTKPLAQYVQELGGYAGMNGTYFCPPDYSDCGGKVNSFDYALYDSIQGSWDNKDARSWNKTGLVIFQGSEPKFYKKSNEFGGGSVTAGISNYPSLLKDNNVVVDNDDLTSYQKDVRGPRGVIGLGGENLYLAIIYNATVPQAAHVMRALGAKHALNLDGGGSSAMYINGGYVVGPGRSLPNAIILVR